MKKKNLNKKLVLNKKTVARLNGAEMGKVYGGDGEGSPSNNNLDCTASRIISKCIRCHCTVKGNRETCVPEGGTI